MKRIKRRIVGILLSIMMTLQLCNVFAATAIERITSEVKDANGGYRKIPVIYNNSEVSEITVSLHKSNTTAVNENERFNISCTANFYVDAYIYKTGDNLKIGTLFTYKNDKGEWVQDWLDQSGQVGSDSDWLTNDYKVTVDKINFMELTSEAHNTRVTFKTAVNGGAKGSFERFSSSNVAASSIDVVVVTQDGLTVTKTAKALAAKNVWEIEVKVEGRNTVVDKATDVVLVLDQSSSMNLGIESTNKTLKCTKEEHKHTDSCKTLKCTRNHRHTNSCYTLQCGKEEHTHRGDCYNSYTLKCTENHEHILPDYSVTDSCYITRADLVKDASFDFLDALSEKEGVNVSVVTYASSATTITNSDLKAGIESAYSKYSQGTNTANGINTAADILGKSSAANKMMVVLSDGESNSGNSKDAATAAKKQGCIIYTIGAGIANGSSGANELTNCASVDTVTNKTKFFLAADSSAALNSVFTEIAAEIQEAGSQCEMSDALSNEFQIVMDSSLSNYGAEKVAVDSIDSANWSNKNIIYTQGEILNTTSKQVKWDIGKLSEDVPAIIRYRVNMTSGALGVAYPISASSQIDYLDSTGASKTLSIPEIKKKALWAGIKFDIYSVDSEKKTETRVHAGSSASAWLKVPEDPTQIPNLKVNLDTKVNSTTLEIEATGDKTLAELSCELVGDTVDDILGVRVGSSADANAYRKDAILAIPNVDNTLPTGHGEIELKATIEKGYNVIQPEGITNVGTEVKFDKYTKDITFKIDVQSLIDETMGSSNLMKFDMTKAQVGVEKLVSVDGTTGKKTWSPIDRDYYAMVTPLEGDKEITVEFNKEGTSNAFTCNSGETYRITVYIPTNMEGTVAYNDYIDNYIDDSTKNTKNAQATIIGSERIKEAGIYDGIYYAEVYVTSSKSEQIAANYIEMAKIN